MLFVIRLRSSFITIILSCVIVLLICLCVAFFYLVFYLIFNYDIISSGLINLCELDKNFFLSVYQIHCLLGCCIIGLACSVLVLTAAVFWLCKGSIIISYLIGIWNEWFDGGVLFRRVILNFNFLWGCGNGAIWREDPIKL